MTITTTCVNRVVRQVHVEVTVVVVIEKKRLSRKSFEKQAVFFGSVRECEIAVIDEQLIPSIEMFVFSHSAHEDVQESISIHISHRHASFPIPCARHAGRRGDVFKFETAPIKV